MRLLGFDLTRIKCHINEGPRECRYLTVGPDGFVCGFLDIVLSVKLAALDRVARGGPCSDPYDETSEALLESSQPKPAGDERR